MQVAPPNPAILQEPPPPNRPRVLEAPGATFTWHLQIWGTPCLPSPPALSLLGFLNRTESPLRGLLCYVLSRSVVSDSLQPCGL